MMIVATFPILLIQNAHSLVCNDLDLVLHAISEEDDITNIYLLIYILVLKCFVVVCSIFALE